jgi:Ca-activated chloride channel family protein
MTRLALAFSVAAITASSWSAFIQAQNPTPTFRGGVRTVAIYATVQERNGRLVPDLTRDDFEIHDNGRPVELTTFSNEQLPITVVVLLDMSNSMWEEFERVREAGLHFVKALDPADRARIGTFGDEIALSPHLTGDKRILARVLQEELWPGGPTPLWTALDDGMRSIADEPGRRVVLTLTDGDDACVLRIHSRPKRDFSLGRLSDFVPSVFDYCSTFRDARTRALRQEFMIYAIGMPDLSATMKDLAAETGGGHFNLKGDANLSESFVRVVEELHHQYLLGFSPAVLDGAVHRLEVRVKRPGLLARARKSYIASEGR